MKTERKRFFRATILFLVAGICILVLATMMVINKIMGLMETDTLSIVSMYLIGAAFITIAIFMINELKNEEDSL